MRQGVKGAVFLYLWSFIVPDGRIGCTIVHEDNMGAFPVGKYPGDPVLLQAH